MVFFDIDTESAVDFFGASGVGIEEDITSIRSQLLFRDSAEELYMDSIILFFSRSILSMGKSFVLSIVTAL